MRTSSKFLVQSLALSAVLWCGTWVGHAQLGPAFSGAACGCPEIAARDTVWVTDNDGAGVGTATWTCDHLYVLGEQVFVNATDTLTIEPGTVVLGFPAKGGTKSTPPCPSALGFCAR